MNAESWKILKRILEEALEMKAGARGEFLKRSCADGDMLREAESLLLFEESQTDPLDQDAFSLITEASNNSAALIDKQIGAYRIISELGEGGMGTVFLAERSDGKFHQEVALKLIKRGLGSDSILRRFESERQILASLNHPNIAHLIDGGSTDDDLPYFVMEYVKGETIVEFARNKDLDLEQRLDLFREVCSAVSFAHQNLVIHRDLKPTNILVNTEGVPKLLDFGIAKLLKVETSGETATQHFVFTPEYASPEQIRGERLTTATDIYSLGVILYELLTGTRPFSYDGKNFGQIIQTATQAEPVKPSDSDKPPSVPRGRLKGDVDNIVLMALKKLPERRYSSVEQMSVDIRRYLKGLPVFARQDTRLYRAEKFVRRNPFIVASVALAFLILIAGVAGVTWQARIANTERAKAERRFNDVRTLANSFIFEVNERIGESPIQARELLVTRSLEYLDTLATESEGDTELQSELAAAYEKIGNVQSELFNPSTGKTSEALRSQEKSLHIREKVFAASPNNVGRGIELGKSLASVGDILSMSGRVAEAGESYRRAIRLNETLLTFDGSNLTLRRSLASNYARLGQAVLRSGSLTDALANYNRSLEIYQALAAEYPSDTNLQRSTGIMYSYIGYATMEMGRTDEAVQFFDKSLAINEALSLADSLNLQLRSSVVTSDLWVGVALSIDGKAKEGLIHIRRALASQTAIYNADKGNLSERNSLGDSYLELGRSLTKQTENAGEQRFRQSGLREAIHAFETAIFHYEAVWQVDRQNFSSQRQIAFTKRQLANVLRLNGERAKALQMFEATLLDFEELTQKDPNNTEWRQDLAICHLEIGEIQIASGDTAKGSVHINTARQMLEALFIASPETLSIKANLETARKYGSG